MSYTLTEAKKIRMMGGNLKLEDRTNPVVEYRCENLACDARKFNRHYAGTSTMWHCQKVMIRVAKETRNERT